MAGRSKRPSTLAPNTLRPLARERARSALRSGALQPIQTQQIFIPDQGVNFAIRIVSSLARKETARKPPKPSAQQPSNPFLPYDEQLFVADLSETHLCLLNKFKVIDEHLLIVTREFEEQETVLTLADFEALWACLVEFDSLGFYNGGTQAGASQPHKHLQLVPLPLCQPTLATPITPLLQQAKRGILPALPFPHRYAPLRGNGETPAQAAEAHRCYLTLLAQSGLATTNPNNQRPSPYNLLVTREWMLLVPRRDECFQGISINALGFAGSFFVKNQAALQIIQTHGPMRALQSVAGRN